MARPGARPPAGNNISTHPQNHDMMMRRTLIPLLMLPVVPLAAQEPADSVQRALDEVTVEAARQYVTPEKAVYIPEEKQKKASADAVALLARMSIPSLRVNALQQTVSTAAGQDVKIFIDFLPATSDDITGMRMKDVRRVEVLDYPDDPRFHGAEHVVNFIMQKYEYGGYAKVYNQLFTTFSDLVERPRANAKFSYRRMTYDLVVGGDVCHGNQLSQEEHSTFLFPGLTPSEEITRDQMPDGDGRLRYHSAYTTFRAVYNADKMQIANSVGFNYTRQPHFDTFSRTSFAGIGLPSEQTASLMQRLWRTLEWNGDYYFALPHNFTLTVNPIVNYSYSERNSTYTVANLPSIENFATSKSTAARLNTRLNRKINDRITLWADISGGFSRNSVEYAGTSPGKVTLDHSFFGPGVGVSLRLPSFYASADAGYAMEWSDTGQSEDTPRYPYVHLSANYTFSQKLSVGLFTQFASNTPDAADRSPVMQQQNEFMWNCGNPYLTSSRHFTFQAWGNWMPSNLFQMSGYVTYYHLFDNCRQIYRPEIAPDGRPMMLSSKVNSGDYNSASAGVNFTLKLLKNSLQISGGPSLNHYSLTGVGPSLKRTYLTGGAQASYYLGSFNFIAYYYAPSKSLGAVSGAEEWNSANYAIGAGWANNDWSVQLYGTQLLSKNHVSSRTDLSTPYYIYRYALENGNNTPTLYLTVSYTVGFGKKVQRGNEVDAVSAGSDGILQ